MPHIHELYDFTASGYIVRQERILLIHHKKFGTWVAPGGHIELDEMPLETLWREVEEEVGLTKENLELIEIYGDHSHFGPSKQFQALPLPFHMFVVDYNGKPDHKHIDLAYLIRSKTDNVKQNDQETHGVAWFDRAQIEAAAKDGRIESEVLQKLKLALELAKQEEA